MGWSSGSAILDGVAISLDKELGFDSSLVLRSRKVAILAALINELEQEDADTLDESFDVTEALDLALVQCGYHLYKDDCEEIYDRNKQQYICSCGWNV